MAKQAYEVVLSAPPGARPNKMTVDFWDWPGISCVVEVASRHSLILYGCKNGKPGLWSIPITSYGSGVSFQAPLYLAVRCSSSASLTESLRSFGVAVVGE